MFSAEPPCPRLLSGRTYTVGLITADSFGRFTIPVMLGVEEAIITGRRTHPRPPIATGLPVPVVYVMTQAEDASSLSLIPDTGTCSP